MTLITFTEASSSLPLSTPGNRRLSDLAEIRSLARSAYHVLRCHVNVYSVLDSCNSAGKRYAAMLLIALNPVFIHVTFTAIVPGACPGEANMCISPLISRYTYLLQLKLFIVAGE